LHKKRRKLTCLCKKKSKTRWMPNNIKFSGISETDKIKRFSHKKTVVRSFFSFPFI
jgi:hypothetical protein